MTKTEAPTVSKGVPSVSQTEGCNGCPMQRLFPKNAFVGVQLPIPSKDLARLVCAEAPGEEEALAGKPLVGGSGHMFDSMLRQAHIPREGLTIINTVNCRPPENIYPTDSNARKYISKDEGITAVKHCICNHVLPVLESRPWKRIDLLGDKALRWIGLKNEGVYTWRGSPIVIDTDKIRENLI